MDLMSKQYREYRRNEFMHTSSIFQYRLRRIYTSFIPDAYLNPLLIEKNIPFLDGQNFIQRPFYRHDKLNFEFNRIILQATNY